MAQVGLGGEQELESDVLRSGWVGEEFVGFVVWLELAAEVRGVGFLVLEEFVVLDCGVVGVQDVVGLGVDGLGEVGGREGGLLGAVVGLGYEGSSPLGGAEGGGRFGEGEAAWECVSGSMLYYVQYTYHAAVIAI